jgi:hypothetical protein
LRIHVLAIAVAVAALFSASTSQAASKSSSSRNQAGGPYVGIGAGEMLPEGSLAEFNDPSWLVQSRSLYVEKIFGGRAAAYYGETKGAKGVDGGRVYGFDFDLLLKLGSARAFGYVFGGAGYGSLTFTREDKTTGLPMRDGGHDWCWTGGVGFSFKAKHGFYIEASYVSFQTNPHSDFIPVVLGFQF